MPALEDVAAAAGVATLTPIVRRALESETAELTDWRRAFRAAIAGQPLTLCHLDAGSQNLFARRNAAGEEETVAIDWELMGTSPLTTEITYLVMQTLRRFDIDIEEADRFEELVLGGYIQGLRDAGWSGEDVAIRRACTAGIALRTRLIPQVLSFILDEAQRAKIEPIWNRSPEQLIERWAWLAYFVLDRADRTRELLEDA